MYRYLVFWAVGLLLAVYGAILYRIPRDRGRSISQHIAERKGTFLVTAVAFTVYGVLMYLFFSKWLQPTLQLPMAFTWVVYLSTLANFVTAWVPDTANVLQRRVHRLAAYGGMAILSGVIVGMIALFAKTGVYLQLWALIVALFMMCCAGLYFFVRSVRKHYLFYQSAYILGFFSVLAAIALLA